MRILSFDTSTSACSSALIEKGEVRQHSFEEMPRGQSEALMPLIKDQMAAEGWAFADLDLIAVTTGPGAFTGLRIGLAAARGLHLASSKPLIGISTFDVLAHGIAPDAIKGQLVAAIESKRADIFVQAFNPDKTPATDMLAATPEALDGLLAAGPLTVIGDAGTRALEGLQQCGRDDITLAEPRLPDAIALGELAINRWTPGDQPPLPAPIYLRPPDAKLPKNGGRLRP